MRASLAPGHVDLGFPLFGLGKVLTASGRAAEAEPLLVEAVDVRRAHLPAGTKTSPTPSAPSRNAGQN